MLDISTLNISAFSEVSLRTSVVQHTGPEEGIREGQNIEKDVQHCMWDPSKILNY